MFKKEMKRVSYEKECDVGCESVNHKKRREDAALIISFPTLLKSTPTLLEVYIPPNRSVDGTEP